MTSVLSRVWHHIECLTQSFLVGDDPDLFGNGSVSFVFALSHTTGIDAKPEVQRVCLHRNLCLVVIAFLHFNYNMMSGSLTSLGASARHMPLAIHGTEVIGCLSLIGFSMYFLLYLWTHDAVDYAWLLAVLAFSGEVAVKAIISLLIYGLYMADHYRPSTWEPFDDYVYYIRSTGHSVKFILGLFLLMNGAWILLFDSWATIPALMVCIHAYLNIWLQAKAGWTAVARRCHAYREIHSLPEASDGQLRDYDDVCAICYQRLTTARITKCGHYFHGLCLRKCLSALDMCPVCRRNPYY